MAWAQRQHAGASVNKYRMVVCNEGHKLYHTYAIYASSDPEAKAKARQKYDKVAKEENALALDRFILYGPGNRLVCESSA